jgi:hypothetical protein
VCLSPWLRQRLNLSFSLSISLSLSLRIRNRVSLELQVRLQLEVRGYIKLRSERKIPSSIEVRTLVSLSSIPLKSAEGARRLLRALVARRCLEVERGVFEGFSSFSALSLFSPLGRSDLRVGIATSILSFEFK